MADRHTRAAKTKAPPPMEKWYREPSGVHKYRSNWLSVDVYQIDGCGWFFDCRALALDTIKLQAGAADPAKREAAERHPTTDERRYFRALKGGLVA